MSKARNLADLLDANGDVELDALDNAPSGSANNLIINGAMNVWQRGTSADTASSGDLMCDRWKIVHNELDGNVDWDQETADTPDGFSYALKISTDASEASLDTLDYLFFRQQFEGQDLQHLQKGTSGAKSLTLSFWVKSSVASTYTVGLWDEDNARNTGQTYSISSANTWEFKTVTFDGDTAGAFDNDNGDSLRLEFWIDAGSTFTSGTFSTTPQALNNAERVYDTTGWLESATPTFYITGVQLEVGTVATPFEHRSFGEELALCQRYYWRATKDNSLSLLGVGGYQSSAQAEIVINFPTTMRSGPSLVQNSGTNYYYAERGNAIDYVDDFNQYAATEHSILLYNGTDASGSAGAYARMTSTSSGSIAFNAEL